MLQNGIDLSTVDVSYVSSRSWYSSSGNNQNAIQPPYQQGVSKQFNPPGFQQLQQYAQRQSYPQQGANAVLNRQPGTHPSDTEVPGRKEAKEQVKAITLRSGKVADAEKAKEGEAEVGDEEAKQKEKAAEPRKTTVEHTLPEGNTGEKQLYPPPPFPKRLQQQKPDKQFGKFLEVFKKLHINIPFAEALKKIPSYAKFMKSILSRKVKLDDLETVTLTEECSAVLQ
ncbi:hypothetical protein AgCh_030985 [Apium graveolens]